MAASELEVRVGLVTDKFDRQINQLNKKIDDEEKKKIEIDAKVNLEEQQLQAQIDKTNELADAYQKLSAAKDKADKGIATPQDFRVKQNLEAQYGSLEKLDSIFQRSMDKQDQLSLKVEQTKSKYDDINNKVTEYQNKINNLKLEKHQEEINNVKKKFNDVNRSLSQSIKNIGRMALSVIGIGAAFSMIRSASSQLASYDEQYATSLEYIRFALAQAIAPILRYIVNLAMTLLSYINAILNALFGINIFSNASADDFNKMKKGAGGVGKALGGAAKSAKEIKKQLAGFDEANILQDQNDSSGGGGGGAGGGVLPPFDLSKLQGQTPEWLKWIADNKEIVLGFLARFSYFYRTN